ncbi:integration host factor, actinobacterial type [Actinomycetaceae bacterium MB13-C1-2]|nr:integration host factor, actinobacterial type [Actinomycetaceae bacterium MB13-C1-2]
MALPALSQQQRAEALEKATIARRRRAEIKTGLKKREYKVSEVLELGVSDEAIAKMRVKVLLESLPRVGPQRASQLMDELGIAETRRVRGLGPLQRRALVERFG